MEGNLSSAIQDLATSGLTPQILGVPIGELTKNIIPLSLQNARKFFPKESSIFKKNGELRPKDGYFWEYNGTVRFKNLDPDFLEYKDGKVVIDRITGLPKRINYLSGGKTHLYFLPADEAANESTKGYLWFTEGEKKKELLTYLCMIRLVYQDLFRAPYLSPDYKYGVFGGSGVFNFICTPEWKTIQSRGKPIMIAFDADWETNTDIPFAELKLIAALVINGASLKKIKSLIWNSHEGKGVDDYLYRVYSQAMGDKEAFQVNGKDTWKPCIETHPMLNALNRLVKMAVHPFQKYEMMGLDFICQALASVYRQGLEFKKSHEEEIIAYLKSHIFTKARLSVIRATFADAVKHAQLKQALVGDEYFLTEQRIGDRFAAEWKHKLRWNRTRKTWMVWTGKLWETDNDEVTWRAAKQTIKGIQTELPTLEGITSEKRRELALIAYKQCETKKFKDNLIAEGKQGTSGMTVLETTFDANPYMLNSQNGMLHLDKFMEPEGGFAWHTPEAYCSQILSCGYEPSAQCPEWLKFINMIFDNTHVVTDDFLAELDDLQVDANVIDSLAACQNGDNIEYHPEEFETLLKEIADDTITSKNAIGNLATGQSIKAQREAWKQYCYQRCRKRQPVVDFVQQCVGLGLSGLSNEKVLLFCYGPGGDNGKTTFFNVMERLLGEYFYRINIESLLYTKMRGQNNDEIADMKGKRMVVTSEVSEGSLNVSLIKTLTGAEGKIKATRKYEHPMEFRPSHTLWMFGNQMPRVHVINDPIWQRIKVIRFTVSIPDVLPKGKVLPQDKAVDMLCEELPGILNWALRGWMHYQQHGLLSPKEIELESLRYKTEQDKIGLFFEERCVLSTVNEPKPGLKILRGRLYEDYIAWCTENHEKPIGKIRFYNDVETRGFLARQAGKNHHYFHGIGLVADIEDTADNPFGYND